MLVNVTVVRPTDRGFLSLRPEGATGDPTTSTVNFTTGSVEPNAATVDLNSGMIQVWVETASDSGADDVLIDVVGYTIGHTHDYRYYTEAEVDAAVAERANSADVYTKTEVDANKLFAVVAADGTLSRGSNGKGSTIDGDYYGVFFNRNVADCAYLATVGSTAGGILPSGSAAVARREASPIGIFIKIFDDTGSFDRKPFHLLVQC